MASDRRLAAILFTDLVDSTAQMARSEKDGLRAKRRHRALVRERVATYGGELIESPGDETLSIFPSALDAVNCALAIDGDLAGEDFRLHQAIHSGDVLVEGHEVHGDGVNVAARLLPLSTGGGICISEEVRHSVRNQPELALEALGPRELRNVGEPINVFAVRGRPTAPGPASRARRRPWPFAAAAAVALLAALWLLRTPILGLALDGLGLSGRVGELALPQAPSLVVLPFTELGAVAGDRALADGITEDLTTDLLGIPELFVVSRNSAYAYSGRNVDAQSVGKELGVRYVIHGRVRRSGDDVRVSAELTDATTGFQVWSERYDRQWSDLFELQSDISEAILTALNLQLHEAERRRVRHKPTSSLTAYELAKRANAEFYLFRRAANARARALYERAIELDSGYVQAYAFLANTYNYEFTGGWNQDESLLDRAEEIAGRAVELDPTSPEALVAMTAVHIAKRRFAQAVATSERAIAVAPSYDFAHFLAGMAYRNDGRPVAALRAFRRGLRLDPRGQAPVKAFMADLNYRIGRVEEAVSLWEETRLDNPDHIGTRVALARHYRGVGQTEEARRLLREVLAINPDYRADKARGPGGRIPSAAEVSDLERWLAELRVGS